MSVDILPTVTIIRDGREVDINLSDYDAKKHQLKGYDAPIAETTKLEDMTATQLREYAKENDIDVTGLKSKVDLLEAVKPTEPTDGE